MRNCCLCQEPWRLNLTREGEKPQDEGEMPSGESQVDQREVNQVEKEKVSFGSKH